MTTRPHLTPTEIRTLEAARAPGWQPGPSQAADAMRLAARGLLTADGKLTAAGRKALPRHEAGTLRLDAPVADLMAMAGLNNTTLANVAGCKSQSVIGHLKRGGGIGLDTLAKLVEATGGRLVLRVEKVK